eukprot:6184177-Pleurochrysis_carterae.AAC.2
MFPYACTRAHTCTPRQDVREQDQHNAEKAQKLHAGDAAVTLASITLDLCSSYGFAGCVPFNFLKSSSGPCRCLPCICLVGSGLMSPRSAHCVAVKRAALHSCH